MKIFAGGRYALSLGAAAALAACGGPQGGVGTPAALPRFPARVTRGSSTQYQVVYSFSGGVDGADPQAGLSAVGGTLYGTTALGGSTGYCDSLRDGCGTVFSVTSGGTEKVLHAFGAKGDGASPDASLLNVGGTFYGTTRSGGSYNCYGTGYTDYASCGTVFTIRPSGTERVLHDFGPYEGWAPYAPLIDVRGTLYGTTELSDASDDCDFSTGVCGTVFSITTAGAEKALHDFNGYPDGSFPFAGLTDMRGTLYGTTASAGRHGRGTVFSITTGGSEKVLHSFRGGSDGSAPHAGLVELHGTLYGTTIGGGAYNSCGSAQGCGTVFSITARGKEKVLHSFGEGADGAHPLASLIVVQGTLYGTTRSGGAYSCAQCGTVFSITPGGTERVLHSFGNGSDGTAPSASLIDVNGTLYGTTSSGGAHGDGTVFSLKP